MEFVFVVPRAELFRDCYPQGFLAFADGPAGHLNGVQKAPAELAGEAFGERLAKHGFFVEREHAEHTPALKQIIPYTLVLRGESVFLLRRLKRGGESRLHGKLSLGVGGHLEPVDLEGAHERNPLPRGTLRELEEELELEHVQAPGRTRLIPLGLINDDSNPVGAVHLGVAQLLVSEGRVAVREREVLEGRFAALAELESLRASGADFETWSALLLPILSGCGLGELTRAQLPAYT